MRINCDIILILILFNLTSCSLLLPFYGVKKKTDENFQDQKKYLKSIGVDTLNLYRLKCDKYDSLGMRKYAINLYKLQFGKDYSPIQFRLYDSTGTLITGWEQCFGNAKYFGYFKNYPMTNKPYLQINYNLNFNNDIKLFDINQGDIETILTNQKNFKYTLIIFWASWAGSFNKKNFRNIYRYIDKYGSNNFYILKLNTSIICNHK